MFEDIFLQKQIDRNRLLDYGFEPDGDAFHYTCPVMEGEFHLTVVLDRHGNPTTSLLDADSGEEYTLYRTAAEGTYVGEVRKAIAAVLEEIADRCCVPSTFRQEGTLRLLAHAAAVYRTAPEFPWGQTPPAAAVLRRADSGKWYGIIMTVPQSKLGLRSDAPVEILNLHGTPEAVAALLTRPEIYPAWHMNKKSWFTVILDGSIADAELDCLLAESYRLAGKPQGRSKRTVGENET